VGNAFSTHAKRFGGAMSPAFRIGRIPHSIDIFMMELLLRIDVAVCWRETVQIFNHCLVAVGSG